MFAFRRIAVALLPLVSCALLAEAQEIEPEIPPGYTPDKGKDELGIWMEVEDFETATQQSALLVKDEDLNNYVHSAACRVAGAYCPDLRIYVVRNTWFNAFMTPNGMVVVWTGLLVRVSSEDELAAVLGHELAHYTRLHSLDQLRRLKKSSTVGAVLDAFVGGLGTVITRLDVMAFSRRQEEEADLLGAKFMAQAGYDPHASYRVWNMIVDEETKAAVKSEKIGMFSKTHPDSADRAVTLQAFVTERYGPDPGDDEGRARHVEMLNRHYMMLMEDQVDTNRFGRTRAMLERHDQIGVDQGLVDYFYGEMYRQRDEEGDEEMAIKAYFSAIQSEHAPPEAYRNLGYLNLKAGDLETAQYNFNEYLVRKTDASDRAMIEFYLEE